MRTALFAIVVSASAVLGAQTIGPDAAPSFEAASIKLNRDGGSTSGMRRFPGGRLEATNIPLESLISFVYQLQPFELQGGPSWLKSDRWDVLAKMDGDPPPVPLGQPDGLMLAARTLLADRFKLVLRRETREVDAYQLSMARPDGRPGAGMRPSTFDCMGLAKARDEAAKGGPPAADPNTPDRLVCGIRNNGRRLQFGGNSMTMVTQMLTGLAQRRVVDRTGLTGNWEFDISFAPTDRNLPGIPSDADAPSLFTVIQEQLGLKLDPAKVALPVVVVDRVERPVED
jgi:uncharacterized protein (TIGR03435 family)